MAAFLRSTHVSDSLLGASALLLLAFVVRAIHDHSHVSSKGVATAAFIALLKPLYLFLPFVALVPGVGGEARRRRVLALLVLGAATIVSLELSRAGYVPARQDRPDATGTATELLTSPLRFAKLVTLDLVRNAANYEMGFTGVLGWLDAPVPRTTRRLIFAMFAFIVFVESQQLESSRPMRIAALVLIVASVLLVQLSLFVSWTPPGTERIIGVQGRYFLPIAALVPLTLPRVAAISPRLAFVAGICFVPFSLAVTIVVVAIRYWL